MDNSYNPKEIEEQAQQFWHKKQLFNVAEDLNKEKFYCLSMFPYPSGSLHMGHVRNYTLGDVISRYQRALGKNVLQPIGWDAFGLPAENAAIKHGIHPAEWTIKNIEAMKSQLLRLGNAYDWKREITTSDPEYYRWEQWFFIKLYEKGLVYKKNSIVNWDPVDQTVLANEQVIDGRGWRSGALVEHKEISQWFIKITAYADELLNDLDLLEYWPEQVKQMQRNWIGRSEGTEIYFRVPDYPKRLKIYTTRPDTLMGATYLAVAPDHPLAKQAAGEKKQVREFLESCQGVRMAEAELATMEKRGVDSGLKAIHPITGEEIPVWIANFVLIQYGSGAVMSVPAHDQRDWEFAQKYKLPVKQVIKPTNDEKHDFSKSAYTGEGILIHSGEFDGMSSSEAKIAITDALVEIDAGLSKVHYRLRDWGVSRQRYWGTPIPMIACEVCGIVPVPEDQLPVVLPQNVQLTGSGSPLSNCEEFVHTSCPKCGQDAVRETDTFDTFVESSWYYARFACKGQENAMLDDRAKYWTPVDQYIGGIEHAVMHLLYARFFHKLMRDEGLVNSDEPFRALLSQGMVLKDGHKMSKSKGNTVDPNQLIDKYGADTARLFIMFAAPPEQSLEWSDSGVEGAHRFLKRLWAFAEEHKAFLIDINELILDGNSSTTWQTSDNRLQKGRLVINQILAQVNQDYERQQFNTVVSGCMKMFNELSSYQIENENDKCFIHYGLSILLRLLAPITPHICHHLWQELEFEKIIIDAPWPKVDKSALKTDEVDYVVQVNGKLRGEFKTSVDVSEEALIELAKENVASFISGKSLKKSIVVPHRQLINLVVS
ncbi:leucine--tRNA ligase [Legionella impletisoli]|uniref:Leucine--tRNA ligase n=1 Tax=Legionella impletisoli TaxID=343510 RepID=A0A917JPZ2_9GAMM|nr:leucine--tRNA ligase [Legionella impletisoli]GGI76818.1 leucine--tRNA ligase [Legionella impletisoli]